MLVPTLRVGMPSWALRAPWLNNLDQRKESFALIVKGAFQFGGQR